MHKLSEILKRYMLIKGISRHDLLLELQVYHPNLQDAVFDSWLNDTSNPKPQTLSWVGAALGIPKKVLHSAVERNKLMPEYLRINEEMERLDLILCDESYWLSIEYSTVPGLIYWIQTKKGYNTEVLAKVLTDYINGFNSKAPKTYVRTWELLRVWKKGIAIPSVAMQRHFSALFHIPLPDIEIVCSFTAEIISKRRVTKNEQSKADL